MVNSVVIVLGAATTKEAQATPALLRRTLSGCDIQREIGDAVLLVCGGQTNSHHFIKEADVMADIALKEGLGESRIIREGQSRNTLENAIFSKRLIMEHNWQNITIVSDRHHLLRARMVFSALGIKANYRATSRGPRSLGSLTGAVAYEIPALIWYAIRLLSGHHKQYLKKHVQDVS